MAIPRQYSEFYKKLRQHNNDAMEKLLQGQCDIAVVMDDMLYSITKDLRRLASSQSPVVDGLKRNNNSTNQVAIHCDSISYDFSHKSSNLQPESSPMSKLSQSNPSQLGNRMFDCQVKGCNKGFSSKASLNAHKRFHSVVTKRFQCPQVGCSKTYCTKTGLALHSKVHQDGPKPYRCGWEQCDSHYSSNGSWERRCVYRHIRAVHFGMDPKGQIDEQTNQNIDKFILSMTTAVDHV